MKIASGTDIPTLATIDLHGKRVLVREDFNVPIENGRVTNHARIDAAVPTIQRCASAGAKTLTLVSHLGRPQPGRRGAEFSLAPVARTLTDRLDRQVRLVSDWRDGASLEIDDIALLENIRFEDGELRNDEALARDLAALCDVFVMDAFGSAHRAHASTCAVARLAPAACAGPLLEAELKALGRVFDAPDRPVVAIVGGAKVSTKLAVLESLATKVNTLLIGGGMVNTMLAARGERVGASAVEPTLFETARRIMAATDVPLPVDMITARAIAAGSPGRVRPRGEVASDELILDIGPETARRFATVVKASATVVWNGPLGVFEFDQFGEGTRVVAEAVADSTAFSVAGGGDTLAAVDRYGVRSGISYCSTGGGAFLEFLEGRQLPGVEALRR